MKVTKATSACRGGGPAGPEGENLAIARKISDSRRVLSPTACGRSPLTEGAKKSYVRQPPGFRVDAGIDPYSVGADSISARAPCPYYIRPAGERKVRPGRAILPNKEHRRSGSRVGGAFLNKSLITVRFHAGRHAFPSGWQGSFPPSASGPRSARAAASRAAALQ